MYGTPQDVRLLTGIKPIDLGFENETAEQDLDELITTWLTRITSAINARLIQGEIKTTHSNYAGIVDVSIRTVAKLIAIAQQTRINPIVQINNFAVDIINTSQVIKDLDMELKPYQESSSTGKKFNFYSSKK